MYFLTNGLKLNPIYHVRYWMGLTSTAAGQASRFAWTDKITPAPVGNFYKNWGTETSRWAAGHALQPASRAASLLLHQLPPPALPARSLLQLPRN